jgi:hypothetical protein
MKPELPEVRDYLQAKAGDDKVHIEHCSAKLNEETRQFIVEFRYPLEADGKPL